MGPTYSWVKSGKGREKMESDQYDMKTTPAATAGFADGGQGPGAEACGQPLEAARGKEEDSLPEPPKMNTVLLTL